MPPRPGFLFALKAVSLFKFISPNGRRSSTVLCMYPVVLPRVETPLAVVPPPTSVCIRARNANLSSSRAKSTGSTDFWPGSRRI